MILCWIRIYVLKRPRQKRSASFGTDLATDFARLSYIEYRTYRTDGTYRTYRTCGTVQVYLAFALDLLLVLLFALPVAAMLRVPSRSAALIASFILAWADIVFTAEILGGLGLLRPWPFVVFHAFVAVYSLVAWACAGRPGFPRLAWPGAEERWLNARVWACASIKREPELWLLGTAVALAYLVGAGLIVIVPPNNYDGMTYHLSRVGYWLQHGSFEPWPTENLRQTTSPLNAEIGALWSMMFLRSDVLAGFVQWTASVAGMAAIFGLARCFGRSRDKAVFAALLWATLPQIALQSTTVQNDLTAAAFLVSMLFLLVYGIRAKNRGVLALSGVALGLALGTKITAILALPGLAIGAVVLALLNWRRKSRSLAFWTASCAAGWLVFASVSYVIPWRAYGHPLGPKDYRIANSRISSGVDLELLVSNMARYSYQVADPSGLPIRFLAAPIDDLRERVGAALFEAYCIKTNAADLNKPGAVFDLDSPIRVHEDFAWFGPLGFLLWLPSLAYSGFLSWRRRDAMRFVPLAMVVVFYFAICASLLWSPWRGRYFVLSATCAAPPLAFFYQRGARIYAVARWAIILLAVTVLAKTVARNENKPLIGPQAVWDKDRIARQALSMPQYEPYLRALDKEIPSTATVALMIGGDDWDYPVFGRDLSRTVVPIVPPPHELNARWAGWHRYRYLVVRDRDYCDVASLPSDRFEVVDAGTWKIIKRLPHAVSAQEHSNGANHWGLGQGSHTGSSRRHHVPPPSSGAAPAQSHSA